MGPAPVAEPWPPSWERPSRSSLWTLTAWLAQTVLSLTQAAPGLGEPSLGLSLSLMATRSEFRDARAELEGQVAHIEAFT